MEGTINVNPQIVLVLDLKEALWLQGLLQNSPFANPEDEDEVYLQNRSNMFQLLRRFTEKYNG